MMLKEEHHKNVVNCTGAEVPRDFKRQTLRNALLLNVSDDRIKAAIWRLVEAGEGGQTIRLQAIAARMSCNYVLEWVTDELVKEYKNLAHNCGLQGGNRRVHQLRAGSDGETAMDPAGTEVGKPLDDDDNKNEPAGTAVCAIVANNLQKRRQPGKLKAPSAGLQSQGEEGAPPSWRSASVLWGFHRS